MTIFTSMTWREWCQFSSAGLSIIKTASDGSSAALSGSTVSVASNLPLTNLADRRLANVCRITTTGHDNGDGSYDHGCVIIRWTNDGKLPVPYQPYVSAMALLNCDMRAVHDSCNSWSVVPQVSFWVGTGGGYPPVGGVTNTLVQTVNARQFKGPSFSPFSSLFNQNIVGVPTARLTGSGGAGYNRFAVVIYIGNASDQSLTFDIGRLWIADGYMDATGIDGLFVPQVIDPSVVRRSRGQQVYADVKKITRGLQFNISGLPEQPVYDLDCYNYINDYDGPPSIAACAVESGIHGEVLLTARPSDGSSGTGHLTKFANIYGTFTSPGLQFRDLRGGQTQISGTILEAR